MTILEAVTRAGGMTERGSEHRIQLKRKTDKPGHTRPCTSSPAISSKPATSFASRKACLNNRYRWGHAYPLRTRLQSPNLAFMPEERSEGSMSLAQMVAMARARWKPMVIIAVTVALLGAVMMQAVTQNLPRRRRL